MAPEVGAALRALLGTVIVVVSGYALGMFQARGERRDESRDKALADIYGAMMRFYRGVVAWSSDPDGSPITYPGTSWKDYCRKRFEEFADVYHLNSIWLGRETDELINEGAQSSRKLINEFSRIDANEVRKVLRAEMETSRATCRTVL